MNTDHQRKRGDSRPTNLKSRLIILEENWELFLKKEHNWSLLYRVK